MKGFAVSGGAAGQRGQAVLYGPSVGSSVASPSEDPLLISHPGTKPLLTGSISELNKDRTENMWSMPLQRCGLLLMSGSHLGRCIYPQSSLSASTFPRDVNRSKVVGEGRVALHAHNSPGE